MTAVGAPAHRLLCRYDFVKVYDGLGLLVSLSGQGLPPSSFVARSGQMAVEFTSDSSVEMSGFVARYIVLP